MRLMSAITRRALAAAVAAIVPIAIVPGAAAFAGAMPPEYADPAPAHVSAPAAPAPGVSRPLGAPEVLIPPAAAPRVSAPAAALPPPASTLTVTYAEAVGLFARHGYEDVKDDASLYCAQYGRTAALDARFEVSGTWYVRFDCVTPF